LHESAAAPVPKRLNVTVLSAPYAKFGVTQGAFVCSGDYTLMVISKAWPSWAFDTLPMGFELAYIIFSDFNWLKISKQFFPYTKLFLLKDILMDPQWEVTADVIVSDINPPSDFHLWCRVKYAFIGRHPIRHTNSIPVQFLYHPLFMTHSQSGWVTDGHWTLNVYLHQRFKWQPSFLPVTTLRDLSSVIKVTTGHGLPCPPPPELPTPFSYEFRPGTYHGSGLFPFEC
jgi:hypothetical protein